MKLHLSPDLSLPEAAAAQTFCIVGIRNSGKSTTAVVMAEEMVKAKQQIVVFDPTDTWWGLRAARNGTDPGLPITVLGGSHADAPLESTAGELIADLIVDEHISFVLSLRHFSDGEKVRFVTPLLARLFKRNQDPLHLFFDEANLIAPQVPQKGEEQMLGLVKRVTMQGRTSGLNPTFITQRPAALNKNVMTQCETLIAMRTIGLQDRNAVEDWVKAWAQDKQQYQDAMDALPTFATGTGLYWSPGSVFKVVHFRAAETFDSRQSPKPGQSRAEPKILAPIDLEKLKAKMAATIERAKADDPRELKRQIAELKKQAAKTTPVIDADAIQKAEQVGYAEGRQEAQKAITLAIREFGYSFADLTKLHEKFKTSYDLIRGEQLVPERAGVAQTVERLPRKQEVARSTRAVSSNESSSAIDAAGPKKILVVLAQRFSRALQVGEIMRWADYSERTTQNYLSTLRIEGLCEGTGHTGVRITDAGLRSLGGDIPTLPTGEELRAYYLDSLPSGLAAVLQAVCDGHTQIGKLMEATGYSERTLQNYLSELRSRRLVSGTGHTGVKASDDLFD